MTSIRRSTSVPPWRTTGGWTSPTAKRARASGHPSLHKPRRAHDDGRALSGSKQPWPPSSSQHCASRSSRSRLSPPSPTTVPTTRRSWASPKGTSSRCPAPRPGRWPRHWTTTRPHPRTSGWRCLPGATSARRTPATRSSPRLSRSWGSSGGPRCSQERWPAGGSSWEPGGGSGPFGGSTAVVFLYCSSGAAMAFAWRDYMPTFTDASLVAAGSGLLLWAVLAVEAGTRRRAWAGLTGFVALEGATFVRYTDIVVLGCAALVAIVVWRGAGTLPVRTLGLWLSSAALFGVGGHLRHPRVRRPAHEWLPARRGHVLPARDGPEPAAGARPPAAGHARPRPGGCSHGAGCRSAAVDATCR